MTITDATDATLLEETGWNVVANVASEQLPIEVGHEDGQAEQQPTISSSQPTRRQTHSLHDSFNCASMTFLAIDHSQVRSDDGLYTGEEVCAMLGENDGVVGIEQVGVEMELDEDILSTKALSDLTLECSGSTSTREELDGQKDDHRNDDDVRAIWKEGTRDDSIAVISPPVTYPSLLAGYSTPTVIVPRGGVPIRGRAVENVIGSKRPLGGKLNIMRRQLLTKPISKIKSISRRGSMSPKNVLRTSSPASPSSKRALAMTATEVPCDNSTCDMTHADSNEPSVVSSRDECHRTLAYTPSSITASTCDFAPDVNHHAVFESYLVTNPWEAAKRGDYATLSYIANHDDANIWTQEDEQGHVPLYYACTSYSQSSNDTSFGKYGLESIKLLMRVWPAGVELPPALLEQCRNSSTNIEIDDECGNNASTTTSTTPIIHKDVLETLCQSKKGESQFRTPLFRSQLSEISEEVFSLEGMKEIVPVSFLDDLGDDGYVEDY